MDYFRHHYQYSFFRIGSVAAAEAADMNIKISFQNILDIAVIMQMTESMRLTPPFQMELFLFR